MTNNLYLNNRQYFKTNYSKALEYLIPKYVLFEDIEEFGIEPDVKDLIINNHINIAQNISSILNISAIAGTPISSINSFDGIYKYFIKQNDLTNINANDFYLRILDRFEQLFDTFKSPEQFKQYILNTVLPAIRLNNSTSAFNKNLSPSAAHIYLIENLSWLYFLNTSGPVTNIYDEIADLITQKLYLGKEINLNDAIKLLSDFVWKNNYTNYYPQVFASSVGKNTSGTQQLDKLKTWIDIIYSPLFSDRSDFIVRDKFYSYKDINTLDTTPFPKGPFHKLLRMISFAALDYDDNVERLKSINDIDECPKEELPLLAQLIGFKLFGSDPDRWRLQLKNAVPIYKKAGTKKSLQFALNTIFPKDQFEIESSIKELWESYIPNLIYYTLATESSYFVANDLGTTEVRNVSTQLTQQIFQNLGVSGYSFTSIDENIRLATDAIIYDIYTLFPGSFSIPTPNAYLQNEEIGFFFRGRNFPIPPFEEYPYYMNVELSPSMIEVIVDRLVCFGVPRSFADKVGNYITANVTDTDEEPRSSSWLFFTSGYNPPPNIDDLLLNSNSNRFEYASLWSGKSSHFKLDINASDFDFDSGFQTVESGDAVMLAAQVIGEFAPAHAIPLINLNLSSVDVMETEECSLPIIKNNETELSEQNKALSNYQLSALNVSSYKRNKGSGYVYSRTEYETAPSLAYRNSTSISTVPRNTIRRRNYEKLISKNDYYDRTGFNMPVSFDMSSSLSGIPLGFIPSSLKFESIPDHNNLPSIYSRCETINSNSSYYGYTVSNTVKCRGHLPISYFSCGDYYVDRSQLNDILQTMHRLGEQKKEYPAYKQASSTPSVQFLWKDVYRSRVNLNSSNATSFPASMEDYYNFKFGSDLHKLYSIYSKEFNKHSLAEYILDLDGNNFTSHVYGPLLFNHDFDLVNQTYITSSLDGNNNLLNRTNVFKDSATSIGTYTQSSIIPYKNEYVNSSIVSGIDLIMVSAPTDDYFSVFKIPSSEKITGASDYMFDRTFIKMDSTSRYNMRLRLNVCFSSLPTSMGYPSNRNFLLPNHKYKIKLNSLIASYNGLRLGGGAIGVVVHTKLENNKGWFYGVDGNWYYESFGTPSDSNYDNEAFIWKLLKYLQSDGQGDFERTSPLSDSVSSIVRDLRCISIVENTKPTVTPLLTFQKDDFFEFEFDFHTINSSNSCFKDYKEYPNIHSKEQEYFIEIFPIFDVYNGNGLRRFMLLDKVEIIDETMKEMASIVVSDNSECPPVKTYLSEKDLRNVFKFWNDISGKNSIQGLASRNSTETSSVLLSQGGSRLDYRLNSAWCSKSYQPSSRILTEVEVPV
jgi:hypothetical protein